MGRFRDLVLEFRRASKSLEGHEDEELRRLAEVGKHFLLERARAFVASAAGRPLLYSFASDGTPMITTSSR